MKTIAIEYEVVYGLLNNMFRFLLSLWLFAPLSLWLFVCLSFSLSLSLSLSLALSLSLSLSMFLYLSLLLFPIFAIMVADVYKTNSMANINTMVDDSNDNSTVSINTMPVYFVNFHALIACDVTQLVLVCIRMKHSLTVYSVVILKLTLVMFVGMFMLDVSRVYDYSKVINRVA